MMKRALRNYLFADDLLERDNSFLARGARFVCGNLSTLASLGAAYEFRSDPESLSLAIGAVENLRVWTKYALLDSLN